MNEHLGQSASQPIFKAPGIVVGLIAVLAGVHLALQIAGENWQGWSLYVFAFIPTRISGAQVFPAIYGSEVWSFLTHAFLHADWPHLLFNSLWLLVFGSVVARRLGPLKFLVLAALSAVGGAVAILVLHWGERVIAIGASGAVSGLLAAAIPLMYGHVVHEGVSGVGRLSHIKPLRPAEILTDRRAFFFTLVWILLTLFSGASNGFLEGGQIAWEAHLGGFVVGLLVFYWLDHASGSV